MPGLNCFLHLTNPARLACCVVQFNAVKLIGPTIGFFRKICLGRRQLIMTALHIACVAEFDEQLNSRVNLHRRAF
jgi:hypothetical protein